jgi:hypothetical protein
MAARYMITANLVRRGTTVWLRMEGGARRWMDAFADGTVVDGEAEADRLVKESDADVAANRVVGVYRVEVGIEDGRPVPLSARERIRAAREPTVKYGKE